MHKINHCIPLDSTCINDFWLLVSKT